VNNAICQNEQIVSMYHSSTSPTPMYPDKLESMVIAYSSTSRLPVIISSAQMFKVEKLLLLNIVNDMSFRDNGFFKNNFLPWPSPQAAIESLYIARSENPFEWELLRTYFDSNRLKTIHITEITLKTYVLDSTSVLMSFRGVVSFSVTYSNLRVISGNTFQKMPNLRMLNLRNNSITDFRVNVRLNQLWSLDLSSNRLMYFYNQTFINLPFLKRLNLNNNLFTTLDSLQSVLPNLSELQMTGNQFLCSSICSIYGKKVPKFILNAKCKLYNYTTHEGLDHSLSNKAVIDSCRKNGLLAIG